MSRKRLLIFSICLISSVAFAEAKFANTANEDYVFQEEFEIVGKDDKMQIKTIALSETKEERRERITDQLALLFAHPIGEVSWLTYPLPTHPLLAGTRLASANLGGASLARPLSVDVFLASPPVSPLLITSPITMTSPITEPSAAASFKKLKVSTLNKRWHKSVHHAKYRHIAASITAAFKGHQRKIIVNKLKFHALPHRFGAKKKWVKTRIALLQKIAFTRHQPSLRQRKPSKISQTVHG